MTPLLLGAVVGLGLAVALRALHARPPALGLALAALETPTARPSGVRRAVAPIVALLERLGAVRATTRTDLRVCDRTAEQLLVEQLLAALTGVAVPAAVAMVLRSGELVVLPGAVAAACVAFGVAGWFLPVSLLAGRARRRREAMRHALSSYLDLVNVVLAGGAGVETALEAAADAGDGWALRALRGALVRAHSQRRSPWDCFAELGRDLGVNELEELGNAVRLAGQHGARVRASLAARAASLRGHQLAAAEASANAATERMALPTVALFCGFLLFIGYPAAAQLLGGSW